MSKTRQNLLYSAVSGIIVLALTQFGDGVLMTNLPSFIGLLISAIAFAGTLLFALWAGGKVLRWDFSRLKMIWRVVVKGVVFGIAVLPLGFVIMFIMNWGLGSVLRNVLSFLPDGSLLAAGSVAWLLLALVALASVSGLFWKQVLRLKEPKQHEEISAYVPMGREAASLRPPMERRPLLASTSSNIPHIVPNDESLDFLNQRFAQPSPN